MLSKAEIDQQVGYASDKAFRYYLLFLFIMALGFYSVFFLGVGIVFLIISLNHISHDIKAAYSDNGIAIKDCGSESANVAKNFEAAFIESNSDVSEYEVDEHNTGPSSLLSRAGCAGDRVYDYFYDQTQRELRQSRFD